MVAIAMIFLIDNALEGHALQQTTSGLQSSQYVYSKNKILKSNTMLEILHQLKKKAF